MITIEVIDLIANLVTIFGLLLIIGTFLLRIYQSFFPLKGTKFLVNKLDKKELKRTKNYLYFGENIFFTCIFNVKNPNQTVIDEITLCVEHGLSNYDYLYHVMPNEFIHFSVSNTEANAIVCDSEEIVNEKIRIYDFNQYKGKSYIRKISFYRSLMDVYKERDRLLDKFKNGDTGFECVDKIPIFSPMIYLKITSYNISTVYVVFAFLSENTII